MDLSNLDYIDISHYICGNKDTKGLAVYKKDGEQLEISYYLDTDGFYEDDYFNGTGAKIITNCDFYIRDYHLYNEDGFEIDISLDISKISDLVHKYALE